MIGFIGILATARDYTLQYTVTHTLLSTATPSLPLFVRCFNGRRSLSSGLTNSHRLSYQLLTATAHNDWNPAALWLNQSLSNQLSSLTPLHCPVYNISARTAQKTPFLCCCIQLLPWKHACLLSRYLVIAVVDLLIWRSFSGNWSNATIL
jgi:hypothetical protein